MVIYGTPPTESAMANIKAPVLGIYGGDDSTVVAAVEPTMRAMEKLEKSYEPHIYPGATHFFMSYVVEGTEWPSRGGILACDHGFPEAAHQLDQPSA